MVAHRCSDSFVFGSGRTQKRFPFKARATLALTLKERLTRHLVSSPSLCPFSLLLPPFGHFIASGTSPPDVVGWGQQGGDKRREWLYSRGQWH